MRKKLFVSIFIAAFSWLAFAGAAMAKSDIPEANGTYDVPGRPNMKVRVFVHSPKLPKFPAAEPQQICYLDDLDSSAIVNPTGWHLPSSWTYRLNPSSVPSSVGSGKLPRIASDVFSRWEKAANGKITFKEGKNTTKNRKGLDGQNIIAWGRISSSALGITYTWYYPSSGLVAEADTIMNVKYPWSWTPYAKDRCADANSYDAQNILTHEIGHWVGLDDEYASDYVNNTMYGYGAKGEIKKDTLTTGDIDGVANIYIY